MTIRAGFASIDGTVIDQHFGSAHYWQIYDIDENGSTFVETRKTAARCRGRCEGGFDHILAVLQDCDAIFAARIGDGAAAFMLSKNKRVFEASGDVEDIIAELIDSDLIGGGTQCRSTLTS